MRSVPLLLALAVTACQAARVLPPATPCDCVEPQAVAVVEGPPSSFAQGDAVEILFHGSWYPGHVLGVVGPGRWEVDYDEYDSDWNQLVGPDRIRAPQAQGSGPRDEALPGTAVTSASQLREGARVLVHWGSSWYPCLVRGTTQDGQVQISYVGYGSQWDETVLLDRVRIPPPGAEGFDAETEQPPPSGRAVTSAGELRAGQSVLVLWSGTWYPSVVRSTTQDGQVRIGYVGYGEQSDETVALDRVRLPQ